MNKVVSIPPIVEETPEHPPPAYQVEWETEFQNKCNLMVPEILISGPTSEEDNDFSSEDDGYDEEGYEDEDDDEDEYPENAVDGDEYEQFFKIANPSRSPSAISSDQNQNNEGVELDAIRGAVVQNDLNNVNNLDNIARGRSSISARGVDSKVRWSADYADQQLPRRTSKRRSLKRHRPPPVPHSHTFPPSINEFVSYQNGGPVHLFDGKQFDEDLSKAPGRIGGKKSTFPEPRWEEAELRRPAIEVKLENMPQRSSLLLAASQPTDIAQCMHGQWSDEALTDDPVCGVISLISHFGAFIWFGLLIWQIHVRDQIEARKWEVISDGWDTHRVETGEEFDRTLLIIVSVFLGISYLTILFEALASYAETYLSNFITFYDALDYTNHVRRMAPRITWTLECYTLDEQPVQSYTKLEEGETVTKANERVKRKKQTVTFDLPIRRCADVSGNIKGFRPGVVSRVEMDKTFGFLNMESSRRYEKLKLDFLSKYPDRSKDATIKENLQIDGYKERMTVYFAADGRQRFMHKRYFWLTTLCFLGWPYRWWFNQNTEKTRYTFVKLIELDDTTAG